MFVWVDAGGERCLAWAAWWQKRGVMTTVAVLAEQQSEHVEADVKLCQPIACQRGKCGVRRGRSGEADSAVVAVLQGTMGDALWALAHR